jgi:hypothetical protein
MPNSSLRSSFFDSGWGAWEIAADSFGTGVKIIEYLAFAKMPWPKPALTNVLDVPVLLGGVN